MSKGLRPFKNDLKKLAQILDVNLGTVVRKVAFDLHAKIVLRTPVDTGRARAGWDITVSDPTQYLPPPGQYGDKGPPSGVEIHGDQPVYVVNNVEYIEALEYGHSKQAPAGMVRISIVEEIAEIEETIAALT